MARVNLTLDKDTYLALERHAKSTKTRRATAVRDLLREGLARREALEHQRKLAADYAAGRRDAVALMRDFEVAQLDLLDDEEN